MRLAELSSGEMQKGFEKQPSSMSSIEIIDDFLDKLIAGSKPEAGKRIFKLERIDNAASIAIKDVKSSLDLLNFFNCGISINVVFCSPCFFYGLHLRLFFVVDLVLVIGRGSWFSFGCAHLL